MTCVPRAAPSGGAISLASVSVLPPGGNGTMYVIGLPVGQLPWDQASVPARVAAMKADARSSERLSKVVSWGVSTEVCHFVRTVAAYTGSESRRKGEGWSRASLP